MFPQLKKINNESGIVLFIVLMTAIIIMIFSLGILTQSMNEINYAQQQIDQISSEQLTKGIWWNAYATGMTNLPPSSATTLGGGRSYQMGVSPPADGSTKYTAVTSYDTF